MRAQLADTEIFFDVLGAGLVVDGVQARERPTAFVISGGPGVDHLATKARYEPLTKRMQIVFFDHRGNGRSAHGDPVDYTLDRNVADLEALRRHLGLGPIISIGNSYGGIVAMAHAARFPESVSHLIVGATVAHHGYVTRARELVMERGTPQQIAACEDLFAGRLDTPEKLHGYFAVMGPLYSRKHDRASGVGMGATILAPQPLNRAHGPGGFLRSFDLRPELASIKAPTLVLAGRHDWIAPPEFSTEIHRLIPGSTLRIFEDSAHTISRDVHEQYVDVITRFLDESHGEQRAASAQCMAPTAVTDFFSADHIEAARKFVAAGEAGCALIEEHRHPLRGPDGEQLATHVALLGERNAPDIFVIVSGTHGLEGLAGAGCQLALLSQITGQRASVAFLFVHLLNPWGTAWSRRQTEENVDLNRNFLAFDTADRPQNASYRELHEVLLRSGSPRAETRRRAAEFIDANGFTSYVATLFRGQYSEPAGLTFGGSEAAWSNRLFQSTIARHVKQRRRAVLVDLHTGLGPYGHGTVISTAKSGSAELTRLASFLGARFPS